MFQKPEHRLLWYNICAFPHIVPLFTFVQMDIKRNLNNYKCKISIKFTEKSARFYRKLFAIFVAEKVFVGIIRMGLWEDL